MKIYNTLTRGRRTSSRSSPARSRMYVCGVTVYDLLPHRARAERHRLRRHRRYLRFAGLSGDVRPQLHRRRRQDHQARQRARGSPRARSRERYIAEYREDMAALGVLPPDVEPKATEHIPEMIALIERLIASGVAYAGGRRRLLRGRGGSPPTASSRARTSTSCRPARASRSTSASAIPLDFALWKARQAGRAVVAEPVGPGPAGLAHRVLGDGHAATWARPSTSTAAARTSSSRTTRTRSPSREAATGEPVRALLAAQRLASTCGGRRCPSRSATRSRSATWSPRHDPEALRLYLLGTHYRNPLEFAEERVRGQRARPGAPLAPGRRGRRTRPRRPSPRTRRFLPIAALRAAVRGRRWTTTSTRRRRWACSSTWPESLLRPGEAATAAGGSCGASEELVTLAGVLGLQAPRRADVDETAVNRLIEARAEARRQRTSRADEIRAEIEQLGAILEDTPGGTALECEGPVSEDRVLGRNPVLELLRGDGAASTRSPSSPGATVRAPSS